jgi:hypothetical protein
MSVSTSTSGAIIALAFTFAVSIAATGSDNLAIMNPDAGIFPHGITRLGLVLTKEAAAPGERQSVRIDAPGGGYADVDRTVVSGVFAWGDWRDYGSVRFWVRNTNDRDVEMHFNIKSCVGGKIVNGMKYFKLKPGDQTIILKLDDCLAAGKVKPNLNEVSNWLFAFDEGFDKPLYIGSITLVRSCKRLLTDRRTETFAADWQLSPGVGIERIEKALCLQLTAPQEKITRSWWTIPRANRTPYQVTEGRNIWRGYEKLAIDFSNPTATAVPCWVLFEDQTAAFAKKPGDAEGQIARIPIQIPSGDSIAEIPLGDLPVADGARCLDLNDVRRIGLEFSAGGEPIVLAFDNFRLMTSMLDAGELPQPMARIRCAVCGLGLSDQYAQQCPRCGDLLETGSMEPAPEEGSIHVAPAADTYLWMGQNNGTMPMRPTKDKSTKSEEILALGHYDLSSYENRVFIRFDLAELELPQGTVIDRAELRLFAAFEKGRAFKPYLPPLNVYSAEGKSGRWEIGNLTWATQPTADRWIFNGGLCQWRKARERAVIDLTEYVREKAVGDRSVSLILKATTAGPCSHDNHMMGHMINFYSTRMSDPALRPYLHITLGKAP